MKQFIFYRGDNDFTDLLAEKCINKADIKLFYTQHVIIAGDFKEEEIGYLLLKYGEEMVNPIPDLSPVPYVDYTPQTK